MCVEKLHNATLTGCSGPSEQLCVLNCVRLLTRFVPYIFEDPDWRGFFWSTVPGQDEESFGDGEAEEARPPLAHKHYSVHSLCECLTWLKPAIKSQPVPGQLCQLKKTADLDKVQLEPAIWSRDTGKLVSDLQHPHPLTHSLIATGQNCSKLLLTCFSEAMYLPPTAENHCRPNKWLSFFSSSGNRHALPVFTSLLNLVCSYDPIGYGVPYNHLMFADYREPLVEVAAQLLVVLLDHETMQQASVVMNGGDVENPFEESPVDNLFCNYLSRIHREEDFYFILHGVANLLNNPLIQTYLPNSCKKVSFHQELLVLFWKMCDQNKKFLFYVLKSSDVLDILVPILYHLNDARSDQSRVTPGLMHIGVFILLLLSGERNFGVRLNKPYSVRVPMDIPVFTGTHADFLVIVFHKIITNGHQRLQPLFDCLLTIIVNVSPYLKSLSMVAANKLLHLLEAFSTPWFLFSNATNHHLVFFLLEKFNNIIQYQFDGNSHLVYAIIRKRKYLSSVGKPSDGSCNGSETRRRRITSQGSDKDAPASSSEGEEKKPVAAASTSGGSMPEMSADMSVKEVRNPASESESSDIEARSVGDVTPPSTPGTKRTEKKSIGRSSSQASPGPFVATPEWVQSWKQKLPLQTIMRMLQVLVPQVEKICIDKGLTDESEIIKFLQHGTLVGLLPVPHPILIRKYQANSGTVLWGIIYLRNIDPPIWYDTDVKLFEIQRV
ncbi:protein HID1-like [Montipora capricornis]|uniref:protein HID1-like n=1 Tax=Montipora capricornis TaxID=246305 RepID=UPI0035F1CC1E